MFSSQSDQNSSNQDDEQTFQTNKGPYIKDFILITAESLIHLNPALEKNNISLNFLLTTLHTISFTWDIEKKIHLLEALKQSFTLHPVTLMELGDAYESANLPLKAYATFLAALKYQSDPLIMTSDLEAKIKFKLAFLHYTKFKWRVAAYRELFEAMRLDVHGTALPLIPRESVIVILEEHNKEVLKVAKESMRVAKSTFMLADFDGIENTNKIDWYLSYANKVFSAKYPLRANYIESYAFLTIAKWLIIAGFPQDQKSKLLDIQSKMQSFSKLIGLREDIIFLHYDITPPKLEDLYPPQAPKETKKIKKTYSKKNNKAPIKTLPNNRNAAKLERLRLTLNEKPIEPEEQKNQVTPVTAGPLLPLNISEPPKHKLNKRAKRLKKRERKEVEKIANAEMKEEEKTAFEVKDEEIVTPEIKVEEITTTEVKAEEITTIEVNAEEIVTPEVEVEEVLTTEVKAEKIVTAEVEEALTPEVNAEEIVIAEAPQAIHNNFPNSSLPPMMPTNIQIESSLNITIKPAQDREALYQLERLAAQKKCEAAELQKQNELLKNLLLAHDAKKLVQEKLTIANNIMQQNTAPQLYPFEMSQAFYPPQYQNLNFQQPPYQNQSYTQASPMEYPYQQPYQSYPMTMQGQDFSAQQCQNLMYSQYQSPLLQQDPNLMYSQYQNLLAQQNQCLLMQQNFEIQQQYPAAPMFPQQDLQAYSFETSNQSQTARYQQQPSTRKLWKPAPKNLNPSQASQSFVNNYKQHPNKTNSQQDKTAYLRKR